MVCRLWWSQESQSPLMHNFKILLCLWKGEKDTFVPASDESVFCELQTLADCFQRTIITICHQQSLAAFTFSA